MSARGKDIACFAAAIVPVALVFLGWAVIGIIVFVRAAPRYYVHGLRYLYNQSGKEHTGQ